MSKDLSFEVTEFFQDRQQRFEAAIKFSEMAYNAGLEFPRCIFRGIEQADELIAELNKSEE